jgi:hypothetical protein
VASVPQLDVDGKYVLCGGGKSIILDSKPSFFESTIIATAPLRDMTYKFPGSAMTGEERAPLAEEEPQPISKEVERMVLHTWQTQVPHM